MDRMRELAYGIVEATMVIMINTRIQSRLDAKAKNLILAAMGFFFYLLTDAAHIYGSVWRFTTWHMLRHPPVSYSPRKSYIQHARE